jgi:transcriptional regulator with XRE-family HTH domain
MKTFGENLQDLMKKQRLSVQDLARDLGVPDKTVREWVGSGGRTPRNLESIKKLADYFKISTHFILFGEEDPKSSISSILEKTELHSGLYEITIKKVNPK